MPNIIIKDPIATCVVIYNRSPFTPLIYIGLEKGLYVGFNVVNTPNPHKYEAIAIIRLRVI
jgi:hypothetical protein